MFTWFMLTALFLATGVMVTLSLRPPDLWDFPTRKPSSPASKVASSNGTKDSQLGCKELRSKRYLSDGFCTSAKPVTEVVCAGVCLPVADLPWYTGLSQRKIPKSFAEWRCVNDVVRREKVHLVCQNGEKRTYKIRVVRSCKCRKVRKSHNIT